MTSYMLGQLFDPFGPRGAVGIAFADVVVVLGVVEEVDVAALAIAAPPPASKPVAARVATSGLIRTMLVHLLSWLLRDHGPRGYEFRWTYIRVIHAPLAGPIRGG